MSRQPAQPRHVTHAVPFDDIAQHRNVYVLRQKRKPIARLQTLRLWKAADLEIASQRAFQRGSLGGRQGIRIAWRRVAVMPQVFFEAERVNHYLPAAAAHAGGNFATEQRRRRTADEDLDVFRIEQPPDEPLPARYDLYLIETPRHDFGAIRREAAVVLVSQQVEVLGRQAAEALVLEVDVGQPVLRDAAFQPLSPELMQERRLARASRADDGSSFAWDRHGSADPTRRGCRQRRGQGIRELLRQNRPIICLSIHTPISPSEKVKVKRISPSQKEKCKPSRATGFAGAATPRGLRIGAFASPARSPYNAPVRRSRAFRGNRASMRYTQLTQDQVQGMLQVVGAKAIRDLFSGVRDEHMLDKPLAVPPGISELELLADCQALAGRNRDVTQSVCFLGGGSYDHFVPTLVDNLAMQGEFLTAYTPYQAEASQGVLQAFFEFQTMICRLTGMDVSNASLYEFSTAAAEAVNMSLSVTGRNKVLVADNTHPDTRAVIDTYARQRGIEVVALASKSGVVDEAALAASLNDGVAAVLVQSPNFFGCIERLDRIVPAVRASGALAVVSFDPLASGVLKPPGAFDADIVVGEGQALGIPPQYGGPYLGLLACREQHLRKIPGRVVGVTQDKTGRRGFCLTLQTREQHIRREKATSNVCTNQGLLAMRASVYMAAMGRSGIEKVASMCLDKSHYAAERIAAIPGYSLRFNAPFFKEFVVQTDRDVPKLLAKCRKLGILAGVPLGRFDEKYSDCFLVAVTEKRSKVEIDRLVDALGGRE